MDNAALWGGIVVIIIISGILARYYGFWNVLWIMLIFGPLAVLIPLAMFGDGNSGYGGAGWEAMLILILYYPWYFMGVIVLILIGNVIKDYSNKNPPANNTRYNNNRSNNTRTAKYLN